MVLTLASYKCARIWLAMLRLGANAAAFKRVLWHTLPLPHNSFAMTRRRLQAVTSVSVRAETVRTLRAA